MSPSATAQEDSLFPDALPGWKIAKKEAYDRDNLFRYIDGAAELYISYGFQRLVSGTYVHGSEPEIVVDLFDMGDSRRAYGIFSHGQEAPTTAIGQGSEYLDGLLRFWKGRYYVSILAAAETPATKDAVLALGRLIARSIAETGPRPEVISLLPPEGLVAENVRYFFHPAWQNSHCHVSDQNLLGIDGECQAVSALYGPKGSRQVLLLVLYPQAGRAEKARQDFLAKMATGHDSSGCWQQKDGKWATADAGASGRLLILVLRSLSRGDALQLADRARKMAAEETDSGR